MKQLILLCALGLISSTSGYTQTVYLADTALITDVGSGGAPASCKANGMVYNSVGMDKSQGTWAADVFTVPSNNTWTFDTVILYGYQYGSTLSSPFTGCYLQIYDGIPGAGGMAIWGDTVTNVLSSSAFTGIYKVDTFSSDNGLLSTKRPIMDLKLHLSPAPQLSAGTYWMSWSATCATTTSLATTPFKVLPGRINPPGQMSRVLEGQSWVYVIDNGDTAGLNMIIEASSDLAVAPVPNYTSANLLNQNIPNPFSNTTTISYNIPETGYVKLTVYNILGQTIAILADGNIAKGNHTATFNAGSLPNGTYYYTLSTAQSTTSRQMVVMK